jgi:hypothetical protein
MTAQSTPARATRPTRRLFGRLLVLGAVAAVYFTLAPRWPKDNVVHIILGVASSEVEQVTVRYAPAPKNGPMVEDWTREATFRFPGGNAPRVLTHEPRTADGDYVLEIEILKTSHAIVRIQRRVSLAGGTTSVDVAEAAATKAAGSK